MSCSERGAVTLAGVAALGVLMWSSVLFGAGIGLFTAHRRAGAAADLAALAGAVRASCPAASAVAASNGATLTDCWIDAGVVRVEVVVEGPSLFGHAVRLRSTARAG